MDTLVGQSLDRYQILALLGEGGMGAVYKARDVTLQRDVAIKVLHRHIARQADFEARFLQEARSAARLDHPGIVQVHDFHQAQDRLYIVMKLIAGANLREMLEDLKSRDEWLPLDEAVALVQQVSLALDYAHRRGVLHRDIKPKNIMIEPEPGNGLPYRPVLTDLGLAKLAEGGIETRAGSSMGTPAYMSPEQALGQKTDARSDVYSLGILLYELSTGQVPFPAKTITEAIHYHTRTAPASPRSIRPDLPIALERVILQALAKEPGNRFTDAASLADALDGVTGAITETVTASDRRGAVSLITQYQRSLENPRGASILEEFDTPVDLGQDSVQVMVNDEVVASVAITKVRLTIGRHANNDIVLEDPNSSRQHACIEFSGMDYRVADLDSRNGTYLANARLLPGMPEVWRPDQPLRIGNTWLRLVRATAASRNQAGSMNRSYAGSRGMDPASSGSSVDILLDSNQLAVVAGGSIASIIHVLNQGTLVDHFQLAVEGIPSAWVSISPNLVHLMPGQQQAVSMVIHPPKSPQSRMGQHPLTICATSQNDPNHSAQVSAILDVAAYRQYSLQIRPQRQTGITEGSFILQLTNQCNSNLTVKLDAVDAEDACQYTLFPPQANIEPGQEQQIQLKVLPRTPLRGELSRTYTFTVNASIAEAPELGQQVHGMWVQSPPYFEVYLDPPIQRSLDKAAFDVHMVNLGQMEFTLHLAANDENWSCHYNITPNQVSIPAGQEQVAALTVQPVSLAPLSAPRSHTFTITAQPIGVTGYVKQVQGTWEHLAPPPPSRPVEVQQPLIVSAPVEKVATKARSKRRWGLGCLVAFIGLIVAVFLGWVAGYVTFEIFGLGDGEAWIAWGIVSLVGLIITGRIAYRVIMNQKSKAT